MDEGNVSYKDLHERFVSGHTGTTLVEICGQLMISVAAVLLRDALCLFMSLNGLKLPSWLKFLMDFIILILPLLLVTTFLSDLILKFLVTLFTGAVLIISLIYGMKCWKTNQKVSETTILNIIMAGKRPFIDYFRAYVNIGTAIVILAVDFPVYPRRFAKAETYGSGSMDVGVGCFVIANAVVSPEARGKQETQRSVLGSIKLILMTIKSCLPLVILGGIRVLTVKGLDYQEHVTEYGVHWNFFITLAVVKMISTMLLTIFPVSLSGVLCLITTLTYQYFLSYHGLSDYIRNGANGLGSRNGIIDANREGIYSSIGYVAIYLAGVQLGTQIFRKRERVYDWCKVLCYIILICLLSGGLLYLSQYLEPISRRLCNAAYIIWMISLNHLLIGGYLLCDITMTVLKYWSRDSLKKLKNKNKDTPLCLLSAVNYNGLCFFLLANLLTGLVNMSIKTIQTPPNLSIIILTVYLLVLSLVFIILYKFKLSVKFW